MNQFISFLIYRFSHIGQIPLCNGLPSRAPHFFGYCSPLCYRCLFIILTLLLSLWICYQKKLKIPLWILVICFIPMIVDGGLQTFFHILSTNLRRVVTGSLFGFGIGAFMAQLYMRIDRVK